MIAKYCNFKNKYMYNLRTANLDGMQWTGNTIELKKFFGANRVNVDNNDNATVITNVENHDENGKIEYVKIRVPKDYFCIRDTDGKVLILNIETAELVLDIPRTLSTITQPEDYSPDAEPDAEPETTVKKKK